MSSSPDTSSRLDRLKRSMPARVMGAYGASKAGNYASGLAFNAFLSMFPLILGVLAVVGVVVSNADVKVHVEAAMISAFPATAQDELFRALNGVHDAAGLLGIISILGLLFAGTNFFAALEFALGQIFGVAQRDFLRQRAMGVVMMALLVVAIVIAVGANALMNLVPVMAALGPLLGAVTMVVLLILVYRVVPNRTFRLAEVWQGAVIAGVLIEVTSLAFPLYGKVAHGFNTYGNTFAIFFLLATWLSLVSQLILLGAVWNRVRLDKPDAEGVFASPAAEGTMPPRPVEAIREQQQQPAEAGGGPRRQLSLSPAGLAPPPPAPRHPASPRHEPRRSAPLVVLGAALAAFVALFLGRRHFGP